MARWVDWLKVIVGVVFLAFGVLWTLQGLNLLQGSFMSGQTMWLVIGIVLALLGVWLLWSLRAGRGKVGVR
jgi:cytochrome bd-type quinol oxidase subunit 2